MTAAELLHRKLERGSQELSLLSTAEGQIQVQGFGALQHMV